MMVIGFKNLHLCKFLVLINVVLRLVGMIFSNLCSTSDACQIVICQKVILKKSAKFVSKL